MSVGVSSSFADALLFKTLLFSLFTILTGLDEILAFRNAGFPGEGYHSTGIIVPLKVSRDLFRLRKEQKHAFQVVKDYRFFSTRWAVPYIIGALRDDADYRNKVVFLFIDRISFVGRASWFRNLSIESLRYLSVCC